LANIKQEQPFCLTREKAGWSREVIKQKKIMGQSPKMDRHHTCKVEAAVRCKLPAEKF
jgi:hypothetical protein